MKSKQEIKPRGVKRRKSGEKCKLCTVLVSRKEAEALMRLLRHRHEHPLIKPVVPVIRGLTLSYLLF